MLQTLGCMLRKHPELLTGLLLTCCVEPEACLELPTAAAANTTDYPPTPS